MYEISVKWPSGSVFSTDGLTHDEATSLADFMWAVGADDVLIRCVCGQCEMRHARTMPRRTTSNPH